MDRIILSGILKNLQEAIDPRNLLSLPKEIYRYVNDWKKFHNSNGRAINIKKLPILFENRKSGIYDSHYVIQAHWATNRIINSDPKAVFHLDLSSHIQFVAQLSAIMPVYQLEYNPAEISIDNFKQISGNLLYLPFADNSIKSVSCLHVIEHIGLGRYGDPIDREGCWKALSELKRITANDGNIFISLPVGRSIAYFNAGYVFRANDISEFFSDFKLLEFSYVDDRGGYNKNKEIRSTDKMRYALGLFHFRKQSRH